MAETVGTTDIASIWKWTSLAGAFANARVLALSYMVSEKNKIAGIGKSLHKVLESFNDKKCIGSRLEHVDTRDPYFTSTYSAFFRKWAMGRRWGKMDLSLRV